MPPRHRRSKSFFHVLGSNNCPYCVMLKGAMMMYFGNSSSAKVCYHDRDTQEGRESFYEEVGSVVPESHRTIPVVVEEFSDGSLKFIGGLDKFVQHFSGCSK